MSLIYSKAQKGDIFRISLDQDIYMHGIDEWFYEFDYAQRSTSKAF